MNESPSWLATLLKSGVAGIPYAGGPLSTVIQDVSTRRQQKALDAIGGIAGLVGLEVLERRTADDPELDALLAAALDAVMRTGWKHKQVVLARVVANAINSNETIDHEQLVVMALSELDAPHLRALARLAAVAEGLDPESDDDTKLITAAGKREPDIVLAGLLRSGAVYSELVLGGGIAVSRVSRFGHELLAYLNAVPDPDHSGA